MLDSVIKLGGYYLICLMLLLWIVILTWRESKGLAIACLFFWPASAIALIQNWGVKGSDIRFPFALLLVFGWLAYSKAQDIQQQATVLTPEFIYAVRQEDPQEADRLERMMLAANARGEDVLIEDALYSEDSRGYGPSSPPTYVEPPSPESLAEAAEAAEEAANEVALAAQRKTAVGALQPQSGRIVLPSANVSIELPGSYRFLPIQQTSELAKLHKLNALPGELGWITHAKVDMSARQPWFVRLAFEPGYLAPGDTSALAAVVSQLNSSGQPEFSKGAMGPTWSAERDAATWGQRMLWGQHTVKLLAHGALVFSMHSPLSEPEELGIRATRLLASKVKPDDGFDLAAYKLETHGAPRGELAAFIAGSRKL